MEFLWNFVAGLFSFNAQKNAAAQLVHLVCEEKATAERVRELFQGDDGALMRACINVAVEWDGWTGPVLWHAACTDGVCSEVVKVLMDEGGAEVDGRGRYAQTPLMVVSWRDGVQADVEVSRGEFVLWLQINVVLTHSLCCV